MLRITLLVLSFCLSCQLFGQDSVAVVPRDTSYWKYKITAGANFNQASFSGNWKAGGVNSIALGSLFRGRADYARKKLTFTNEIELLYGVLNNAGQGQRKNNDRILVDSKLGCKFSEKWNLFASANFLTQFAPGYQYVKDGQGVEEAQFISKFMTPAFLTTTWGFEYKQKDYFYIRLSPLAPRVTIVNDTTVYRNVPANYGVPVGRRTRYEWLALQALASFDKNLKENLNLKLRYMLYANLQDFAFKRVDHRLDLVFTSKVTKYVSVNLTGILLYDIDQDADVQLSQTTAIGLVYSFNRKIRQKL